MSIKLTRRTTLKGIAAVAALPLLPAYTSTLSGSTSGAGAAIIPDMPFDDDWKFFLGDVANGEKPELRDAEWRTLDLPHDWSIANLPARPDEENGLGSVRGETVLPTRVGPFDPEASQGGKSTGWMVGGTGWYRKHFETPSMPPGGRVEIVFDGVYMNCEVWLNGVSLGNHPYGYTRFAYDLTPHLLAKASNTLAVHVRNEGRNSRWYSGSGIYRHVHLRVTGACRLPLGGVFVTTPDISANKATVRLAVRIANQGAHDEKVSVRIRLLAPGDKEIAARQVSQSIKSGTTADVEQTIEIDSPRLWSIASPSLYRAEVSVFTGGSESDRYTTSFGVRTIEADAERGLRINGEEVKLKGGCLHHDNGLLGAATIDRAEERRVELMKHHGFNAIRTSHNPPSTAFLDACDRLGVVVIDEFFDQWEKPKNPDDYHLYFNDWWKRDVESAIFRDRNHPSVILWSIGNEIDEHRTTRGVEIEKQLSDWVRHLDSTRLVSASVNGLGGRRFEPAFHTLDVAGANYMAAPNQWDVYKEHEIQPKRVIAGTEAFPRLAYEGWQLVMKNPWIIGDFTWTGMDHIGESALGYPSLVPIRRGGAPGPGGQPAGPGAGPGGAAAGNAGPGGGGGGGGGGLSQAGFPWFNNFAGDVDLIGQAKPQLFFKHVVWGTSKLEMAVQRPLPPGMTENISLWGWSDELRSWTWPGYEGHPMKVRVYSSADHVQLLLNGTEIATKQVPQTNELGCRTESDCADSSALRVDFEVPYSAGELKAVALSGGRQIAAMSFETTGKPAKLRLTPDRDTIRSNRNDLSYVTVYVLDERGNEIPDASLPVALSVTGVGELAGSGTANPKDVHSFRSATPTTFHGKALAIIRPTGVAGAVTLQASCSGLEGASVTIKFA